MVGGWLGALFYFVLIAFIRPFDVIHFWLQIEKFPYQTYSSDDSVNGNDKMAMTTMMVN